MLGIRDEDWEKLCRMLQYIKGTIGMRRILGGDGLECLIMYVDAAYTVHMDMRGHTGGGDVYIPNHLNKR